MEDRANFDFEAAIELMLKWSLQWQEFVLRHGDALDDEQIAQARCAGVAAPDKVRVLAVPSIPIPPFRFWYDNFVRDKMFDLNANGLTVGCGVFLKSGCFPAAYWLAHELVHVAQYEKFGGLKDGLRIYLRETLNNGYEANTLEQEAHRVALECLRQQGYNLFF